MPDLTPAVLDKIEPAVMRLVAEFECCGGPQSPYFREPEKYREADDMFAVVFELPALIAAAREREWLRLLIRAVIDGTLEQTPKGWSIWVPAGDGLARCRDMQLPADEGGIPTRTPELEAVLRQALTTNQEASP